MKKRNDLINQRTLFSIMKILLWHFIYLSKTMSLTPALPFDNNNKNYTTEYVHLYNNSELLVKVFGNQGIIFQSNELPYYSSENIILDIDIGLNYDDDVGFFSLLESITGKSPRYSGNVIESKISKSTYSFVTTSIIGDCKQQRISNLLLDSLRLFFTEFEPKLKNMTNYTLSCPIDTLLGLFAMQLYSSTPESFYSCKFNDTSNSIRLKFKIPKIPVREKSEEDIKFFRLKLIKFATPQGLCAAYDYNPRMIFLKKNGRIYQTTRMRSNELPQIHCIGGFDHFCYLSQQSQSKLKHLTPDPCLGAIYSDSSIEVIEKHCKVYCRPPESISYDNYFEKIYPEITEVGDTLYISRAISTIELKCTFNFSTNYTVTINPPIIGALEMKMICGCELYYQNFMIWSRKKSTPPICIALNITDDNNAIFEVYQLLPSLGVPFPFNDTDQIPRSGMESKIFYNISDTIVAKELVDEFLKVQSVENNLNGAESSNHHHTSWIWTVWKYWKFISVILFCFKIYKYFRPGAAVLVIPQQHQAVIIGFSRRKG